MEIRLLRREDEEPLTDLLQEMSHHYNGANASPRDVVFRNLLQNILGPHSDVRIVVARAEDRVIGVAMISILYPAPKERAQLFMKELYVAADWRSQGVGQQLMHWIAAYGVAHNCVRFDWTVDAENTRAVEFYRSLGATHLTNKLYFRLAGSDLHEFVGQVLSKR